MSAPWAEAVPAADAGGRRRLLYLRLALTLLTFGAVAYYASEQWQAWSGEWRGDWVWLGAAAFLTFPVLAGRGWKWQLIIRPLAPSVTFRQAVSSYLGSLPPGLITPGRVGEFTRCLFLPQTSTRGWAGAGRVLLDNWTDFLAALPWCVLGLYLLGGPAWALGGAAAAALFFPVRFWLRALRRVAARAPRAWGTRDALERGLPRPEQTGREVLFAFSIGAAVYGLEWLQLDFLLRFLGGAGPGYWELGGLTALTTLANSVQVTLAGLGVREGLSVYLLAKADVAAPAALAGAFGLFALNQILPALAGLAMKPAGLYSPGS